MEGGGSVGLGQTIALIAARGLGPKGKGSMQNQKAALGSIALGFFERVYWVQRLAQGGSF